MSSLEIIIKNLLRSYTTKDILEELYEQINFENPKTAVLIKNVITIMKEKELE